MSNTVIRIPANLHVDNIRIPVKFSSSINPVTNGDYEKLINRPQINGVELIGNKTSAELGIDRTFVFEQNVASMEWTIEHNLNKYPSVSVVDSAGSVCIGEVQYIDENNLICNFSAPFSGRAYLN